MFDNGGTQFEKSSPIWGILHDSGLDALTLISEAENWVSSWIYETYSEIGLSLGVESFISHTNSSGFSLSVSPMSISLAVKREGSKRSRIEQIEVAERGSMCRTLFMTKFDWGTFIEGRFLDSLKEDLFDSFDSYLLEVIKSWMYAKGYSVWQVEGYSLLEAQMSERSKRKKDLQEGLPDYAIDLTEFLDIGY